MRKEDLTFRNAWSWKWLLILTFGDSRKSGFALWLSLVSTAMFMCSTGYAIAASLAKVPSPIAIPQLIDAQTWLLCVGTSAGLFGWGTVADKKLDIKSKEMQGASLPQPA